MKKRTLLALWGGELGVMAALSLIMGLLALSQPLYMLNLFDRVLSSQSQATLISLTVITVFVLFCFGGFDWSRHLIQARMGRSIDEAIRPGLMEYSIREAAIGRDVQQRLGRLDELKNFVTGQAFTSIFDLIFVPIYFSALFLFHPLIGWVATFFAFITLALAVIPEWSLKKTMVEYWFVSSRLRRQQQQLTRNAAELVVLGGLSTALQRYLGQEEAAEASVTSAQNAMRRIQTMNKVVMMIISTLLLGIACYLVIMREISTSLMFAVNIVGMRALQPLFAVTSSFKSLNKAVVAWNEISDNLERFRRDERSLQPLLKPELRIRTLTVLNREEDKKILHNVSMDLDPGELVVVTGASGAGKSTLLRAAVGLVPDYVGSLELQNREMKFWRFDRSMAYIGYLPQEVRLFSGTIAENIALFTEAPDLEQIVSLCTELGLHEDIIGLKDGYETKVDGESPQFSGGQIRLLGLARSMYGKPKMLVLDEPTTGLDYDHEVKVLEIIRQLQAEGSAVLVSTHSAHLLRMATKILWLKWGQMKGYGLRDQVLAKMGMLGEAK